jgi:RNA methyltransferase, TrmH family
MITSSANPTIKMIRKLRDRKERAKSGLFYIEGLRLVGEAAQHGNRIESLIIAPELLVSEFGQKLVTAQKLAGVQILEVSADVFSSFALKDGPQGIAAIGRQIWSNLAEISPKENELWIALDEVADPGNLGTIMRTSDAVGAKGIILLDHSTDPYDPSAVRGSMGAIFSQDLVQTQFEDFAAWKESKNCFLVGTSGASQQDYQAFNYPDRTVILMGSERQGLQEKHIKACDAVVRIPMIGRSDSLNLAVATALVIYEVFNQHRRGEK